MDEYQSNIYNMCIGENRYLNVSTFRMAKNKARIFSPCSARKTRPLVTKSIISALAHTPSYSCMHVCVYMCVTVCVCACMCVVGGYF